MVQRSKVLLRVIGVLAVLFAGAALARGMLVLAQEAVPPAVEKGVPQPAMSPEGTPCPMMRDMGMQQGMPAMGRHMQGMCVCGMPLCQVLMKVRMRMNPGMVLRHGEELQLSEKQVDKLKDINVKCQLERVDLNAALEKARLRLAILLEAEELDMDDVEEGLEKLEEAWRNLVMADLEAGAQSLKVLTDEQRQKLQMIRKAPGKRGRAGGRGPMMVPTPVAPAPSE